MQCYTTTNFLKNGKTPQKAKTFIPWLKSSKIEISGSGSDKFFTEKIGQS